MITEIYPSGTGTFTARIAHGKSSALRTGFPTRELAQAYLKEMEPKMVSVTDTPDFDSHRSVYVDNTCRNRFGRVSPRYILHSERT